HAAADIGVGKLLDVEADHLAMRLMDTADNRVALDKLGDDVVGMGVSPVGSGDGGDPLRRPLAGNAVGGQDDLRLRHARTFEEVFVRLLWLISRGRSRCQCRPRGGQGLPAGWAGAGTR